MSIELKSMTIGQVAKLAGVGVETIRFYEREGLLNKPKRRQSGYRVFTPEVVARIRFIKQAKQLGFSLREIRDLLFLRVDARATPADLKRRVDAKISEIDDRLTDLRRMRGGLVRLSKVCKGKGPTGDSPLLDLLERM